MRRAAAAVAVVSLAAAAAAEAQEPGAEATAGAAATTPSAPSATSATGPTGATGTTGEPYVLDLVLEAPEPKPHRQSAHAARQARRARRAAAARERHAQARARTSAERRAKQATGDVAGAGPGGAAVGEDVSLPGSVVGAPIPSFVIDRFRIPPFLLSIYQAAGVQYGIRWEVLAAINEIETDYGRNLNVSTAGAQGWMQFMPATWKQWGLDANDDGHRDPYNPVDAIFTTARYLKAAGYEHDVRASIYAYNHADWYVNSVLARAKLVSLLPTDLISSLTGLTEGRFPIAATATYPTRQSAAALARKGKRRTLTSQGSQLRRQVDILAGTGSPVVAVQDGRVTRIGHSQKLGRFVQLRDVYGNTYTYANLGSVATTHLAPKEHAVAGAVRQTGGELEPAAQPLPTGRPLRAAGAVGPRTAAQEPAVVDPDRRHGRIVTTPGRAPTASELRDESPDVAGTPGDSELRRNLEAARAAGVAPAAAPGRGHGASHVRHAPTRAAKRLLAAQNRALKRAVVAPPPAAAPRQAAAGGGQENAADLTSETGRPSGLAGATGGLAGLPDGTGSLAQPAGSALLLGPAAAAAPARDARPGPTPGATVVPGPKLAPQLSAAGRVGYTAYQRRLLGGLKRKDVRSLRLKVGSAVVGGTVLGRVGRGDEPHLRFRIRPAGKHTPLIDPTPILDGWRLLDTSSDYGADSDLREGGSVGQILLESKGRLVRRVLEDRDIDIYACGRRDVSAGQIDRRVLATLAFLAAAGMKPTVSALHCGHSRLTTSGNVSEHSTGTAVDISKINGISILGHQGAGSITEAAIRKLLTLQGTMKPHQIISLMSIPGTDNTLSLPDHADHIHVGFRADPAASKAGGGTLGGALRGGDWDRLMARLNVIENPLVPTTPSPGALPARR